MKSLILVLGLSALALVSGCSQSSAAKKHAGHINVTQLAAHSVAGFHVEATLANLGSFEWDTAPVANRAAMDLYQTAIALQRDELTVEQAQRRADAISAAHQLLLESLAACHQNNATGKCTGDEPKARKLLDQARVALSNLP